MIGPYARFRPHIPERPSWRCRQCRADWPCRTSRLNLLVGYDGDRIGLLVYLAAQLTRALQDLPDAPAARLTHRFVYWVPRRRGSGSGHP